MFTAPVDGVVDLVWRIAKLTGVAVLGGLVIFLGVRYHLLKRMFRMLRRSATAPVEPRPVAPNQTSSDSDRPRPGMGDMAGSAVRSATAWRADRRQRLEEMDGDYQRRVDRAMSSAPGSSDRHPADSTEEFGPSPERFPSQFERT